LTIGDHVIISINLVLYTNSHNYQGNCLPFDKSHINSSVVIESNVWIGMNVTISPGTHIGEGAIIGLGTRLFGKIPKLAIVGSQPPKIIKSRDKVHYDKMVKNESFGDKDGNILGQQL
jgi:acetyltransferase-like isoleucine patch superfamily enzyme